MKARDILAAVDIASAPTEKHPPEHQLSLIIDTDAGLPRLRSPSMTVLAGLMRKGQEGGRGSNPLPEGQHEEQDLEQRTLSHRDGEADGQDDAARWQASVDQAMALPVKTRILTKSSDGVDLLRCDFESLVRSRACVNDKIISAWMARMIVANCGRYIAIDSQWYSKYQESGLKSIKKWSFKPPMQVLQAERIYFPTHVDRHWILLIVSPQTRDIECFDSLNSPLRCELFRKIGREWLEMQLGREYIPQDWSELPFTGPMQADYNDCGVFMCLNAYLHAIDFRRPIATDVSRIRLWMAHSLLRGPWGSQ